MKYYSVKEGEHLSGIAHAFGFADYARIWNDPNNAELKQQRDNPHVLFPGDRIYIPDNTPKSYPKPTDQRHRFVLKAVPLRIDVRFERAYYQPLSNTPFELAVATDSASLLSDEVGAVQRIITRDASKARATIHESVADSNVTRDIVIPVYIGYLDPVEEQSGQLRLSNLGYYRGPFASPDTDDLDSAVQEFQCDEGLQVDGVCGPRTQARLKEIHGC